MVTLADFFYPWITFSQILLKYYLAFQSISLSVPDESYFRHSKLDTYIFIKFIILNV